MESLVKSSGALFNNKGAYILAQQYINLRSHSEDTIEKFVASYFEKLGFSTKRQYTIQIGSKVGIVDVVIYHKSFALSSDPLDHIAAIVECKAQGKNGNGVDQLRSYLCATDTRLGVFANNRIPTSWKYYENYGRNDIQEISRKEFFNILDNEKQNQADIQNRIQARKEQRIEEEATKLATRKHIEARKESIIDQEAKRRITENDYKSAAEWCLKKALNDWKDASKQHIASLETEARASEQRLKNEIAYLKTEVAEVKNKNGRLWASILILGFVILALIAGLYS